jgi:beta-galactosidase/beta-glucuronidase
VKRRTFLEQLGLIFSTTYLAQVKSLASDSDGFHLVALDDWQGVHRYRHLSVGKPMTYGGEVPLSVAAIDDPARTYTQDPLKVAYKYSGLQPSARYKVRVLYFGEHRVQKAFVNGVELHGNLPLPQKPTWYEYDVPPQALTGSSLELTFEHVEGPDVVVSAVELWSTDTELAKNLLIEANDDSLGRLVGTVTDNIYTPVQGTQVSVTPGAGGSARKAVTNASGRFALGIPPAWREGEAKEIRVVARKGRQESEALVRLSEVFVPTIRLSPRPTSVTGIEQLQVDLKGQWNFTVQPPDRFWEMGVVKTSDVFPIQVPGEWTLQGFLVPDKEAGGYWRSVKVPGEWAGKRVKLRCDGVYSLGHVWVNGKHVGEHEGGFTPFELDVTEVVQPGAENTFALHVTSDTLSDELSAMNAYAQHSLGGITRKILLFALPEVNIVRIRVETLFDKEYVNATLRLSVGIANESAKDITGCALNLGLTAPDGKSVALSPAAIALPSIRAGEVIEKTVEIPVSQPKKWEAEHPHLYTLACGLEGAELFETVTLRIGFRQVEIWGAKLLINGRPITLRGVERHEYHPFTGRTVEPSLWEEDARLIRQANMNHVFTSHYPDPEEFLDVCDEMGFYVGSEVPFVWTDFRYSDDPKYVDYFLKPAAEMLECLSNHPSIIFWQMGDEATWGRNFDSMQKLVNAVDPNRPANFAYGWTVNTISFDAVHYPSLKDVAKLPPKRDKPTTYDQYCNVNAFNRREVLTDPGIRDYWGTAIEPMWEAINVTPEVAEVAIWSWIDELFYVPVAAHDATKYKGVVDKQTGFVTVGYGDWGLVDKWRRPKPEYWHVKKSYSPIHIRARVLTAPQAGQPFRISAENRYDFTNLNELRIEWSLGTVTGTVKAEIAPRSTGEILVYAHEAAKGASPLSLRFFDARGNLVDAYTFEIGRQGTKQASSSVTESAGPVLQQNGDRITVAGTNFHWIFDAHTGLISAGQIDSSVVVVGGPALVLTPLELDEQVSGIAQPPVPLQPQILPWSLAGTKVTREGSVIRLEFAGHCANAHGKYAFQIDGAGLATIDYSFEYVGEDVSVREIGLLLDVAKEYALLEWTRDSQWTFYPDDHIGRTSGIAAAFRPDRERPGSDFKTKPSWPWSLDATEAGTNDFRSTKYNILYASLRNIAGSGLRVESDGKQHTRAWVDGDLIRLLINEHSNGGNEIVLADTSYFNDRILVRKGATLSGKVRLSVTNSVSQSSSR